MNLRVGSSKSRRLTSKAPICPSCNNSLTQPYDKAWEELSQYLQRNWGYIAKRGKFDLGRVFPGRTQQGALNVHLFFVKLFGCRIIEENIPIDVTTFSASLLQRRAHDEIYLIISETPSTPLKKFSNTSEIVSLSPMGLSDAAGWMYTFSPVSLFVGYRSTKSSVRPRQNTWHPKVSGKCIKIGNYVIET